jgi:hypothetical protein
MSRRVELRWQWGFAMGVVSLSTQRGLNLVKPTSISWIGFLVATEAGLLLFLFTRRPRSGHQPRGF